MKCCIQALSPALRCLVEINLKIGFWKGGWSWKGEGKGNSISVQNSPWVKCLGVTLLCVLYNVMFDMKLQRKWGL